MFAAAVVQQDFIKIGIPVHQIAGQGRNQDTQKAFG